MTYEGATTRTTWHGYKRYTRAQGGVIPKQVSVVVLVVRSGQYWANQNEETTMLTFILFAAKRTAYACYF